jgi:Protein of unknown function (DUF3277)
MTQMRAWNVKDLAISLNAVPLSDGGYGEDEVMKLEWEEDQFTVYVGADGEVSRAATNNGLAKVTLTYAHTAAANDRLTALLKADLAATNGAGAGVYSARDVNGRMLVTSERAWVMAYPSVTLGKNIQTIEWPLQLADASIGSFIGGR